MCAARLSFGVVRELLGFPLGCRRFFVGVVGRTSDSRSSDRSSRAAPGAADLERALREDRRPLAGIFRVRAVPGKSPSGCHTAVFWVVREVLGSLGWSFGELLGGLGAILEPSGPSWAVLGPS